ncbi:hypothetical protein ACLB2K_052365 [Fragaria x ananassa]
MMVENNIVDHEGLTPHEDLQECLDLQTKIRTVWRQVGANRQRQWQAFLGDLMEKRRQRECFGWYGSAKLAGQMVVVGEMAVALVALSTPLIKDI